MILGTAHPLVRDRGRATGRDYRSLMIRKIQRGVRVRRRRRESPVDDPPLPPAVDAPGPVRRTIHPGLPETTTSADRHGGLMKTRASATRSGGEGRAQRHRPARDRPNGGGSVRTRGVLDGPRVQQRLSGGPPDEVYEREAERVPDQVMRMGVPGDPGQFGRSAPGGASRARVRRVRGGGPAAHVLGVRGGGATPGGGRAGRGGEGGPDHDIGEDAKAVCGRWPGPGGEEVP